MVDPLHEALCKGQGVPLCGGGGGGGVQEAIHKGVPKSAHQNSKTQSVCEQGCPAAVSCL